MLGGRRHYGNLEALRGIAALLVVLHHLSLQPANLLSGNAILAQCWLFVDLFFLLSGFVIASVHAESPASEPAAKAFLIRRLFRLYPLHLATLLMALALDVASGTAALAGYWAMVGFNLAMVHSWGLVPGSVLNGPSWSISVEWAAYLLFALICLATPSLRRRLQAMAAVGFLSLAMLLIWRGGSLDGDLSFRLPRCLMSFALGALAWAWLRGRAPISARSALAGQLLVALAMLSLLWLSADWPWLELAMPLLSAAMIAMMVLDPGSAAARFLGGAVPQWLGAHSYSLYLVHMPLFGLTMLAGGGWGKSSPLAANAWVAGSLIALFALSALTYRWIEAPARDFGRRLASMREGAPASPSRLRAA